MVEQYPTSRLIALPFTEIAREQIGRDVVATMVALGAVGVLCGRVNPDNLLRAMQGEVPPGTEEINHLALYRGMEEAKKIDLSTLPRELSGDEDEG